MACASRKLEASPRSKSLPHELTPLNYLPEQSQAGGEPTLEELDLSAQRNLGDRYQTVAASAWRAAGNEAPATNKNRETRLGEERERGGEGGERGSWLGRLQGLRLRKTSLEQINLTAFANSPCLTDLDLSDNRWVVEGH